MGSLSEEVRAEVLCGRICDLESENTKLHERIDAAHMSRLLTENENESLRGLLRDVYSFHWHGADCTECPWFEECDNHGGGCPWLGILANHMREFGIEV